MSLLINSTSQVINRHQMILIQHKDKILVIKALLIHIQQKNKMESNKNG